MAKASGRTSACSKADAKDRLARAQEFVFAAEFVLGERVDPDGDRLNLSGVAAALAVLAGIAATDSVTCHRLGLRSRGQNHEEALPLIRRVQPEGTRLASDLDRLLALKDNAQYGFLAVSATEARNSVERASRMVDTAKAVLGGRSEPS